VIIPQFQALDYGQPTIIAVRPFGPSSVSPSDVLSPPTDFVRILLLYNYFSPF
jgi:hypothetical protein